MKVDKLPCINCITLPICRNRYIIAFDEAYNGSQRAFVHAKLALKKMCPLLRDHFELHYGSDSYVYDEGLRVLYFFFYDEGHVDEHPTMY